MPKKIVLRVAASPLTPAHIAAVYAGKDGSGFGPHDSPSIAAGYYDTVIAALMDSIASDTHFQQGIDGQVYAPTKKPISRLTPRNQFMALSPALVICSAPEPLSVHPVDRFMTTPFILTLSSLEWLEQARIGEPDPETTAGKLSGFVEHYLGAAAGLFLE